MCSADAGCVERRGCESRYRGDGCRESVKYWGGLSAVACFETKPVERLKTTSTNHTKTMERKSRDSRTHMPNLNTRIPPISIQIRNVARILRILPILPFPTIPHKNRKPNHPLRPLNHRRIPLQKRRRIRKRAIRQILEIRKRRLRGGGARGVEVRVVVQVAVEGDQGEARGAEGPGWGGGGGGGKGEEEVVGVGRRWC